jgi:spore coat polysaccharide biosynthesis protein SpsF
MKNSITVIVQARMASTRLPGKVMLTLDGSPVLEHIVHRVKLSKYVSDIIIATTFDKSDDIIAELGDRLDVGVFRGSSDDVLGRVTQAARRGSSEWVIRVTGDNPFVDPRLIDYISTSFEENHDYVSNKLDRTWPVGIDADGFSVSSLEEASEASVNPLDREHITPYYIRNQSELDTHNVYISDVYEQGLMKDASEIRLTLDEAKDYFTYQIVCADLEDVVCIDTKTLVQYINQNPEKIMNGSITQRTNF